MFRILLMLGAGSLLPALTSGALPMDSVESQSRFRKMVAGLSGSFTGASNWHGEAFQSMAVNSYADLIFRKTDPVWSVQHSLHWELGYTRYRDSLWMKHADQLRFQFLWYRKSAVGRYSFSVSGKTQLFDTYYYYFDPVMSQTNRRWTGTLLNPADLEAGYGFFRTFGSSGSLNLAVATVRIRHEPLENANAPEQHLLETGRGVFTLDYGCSVQALFVRAIGRKADWFFSGRFFVNGAGREQLNLDVLNRFTWKIWKFFQLRLETAVVYEPLFSYRIQYRNELLGGVFLDLTKQ